jgi:two-component system, NarL family, response regulator NreC
MSRIRLLIASKHPIVRTALGTLLKGIPDFEVVAEEDFAQLVKNFRQHSPEVFLAELTEAGLGGLRTVASLMRLAPSAAVVILSSNQNPSYIRSLLAIGVRAYVLRSASNAELYEAIRTAHGGRRYLDPRLSDSIADMILGTNDPEIRKPKTKRLSGREVQVLQKVAQGFTTKTIAEKLGVSEKTIQTYRERIYDKLELRTRADLVHYAIAHGMLNSFESSS